MKNKLFIFTLIVFLLFSLFTGCKIQSVEEYHKAEDAVSQENLLDTSKDSSNSIEKDTSSAQKEDKPSPKIQDESSKDKASKTEASSDKKTAPVKSVSEKSKTSNSTKNSSTTLASSKGNGDTTDNKNTNTSTPKPTSPNKNTSKPSTPSKEDSPQYVTLEIRVDTILKNYDKLDPALKSEKFVPSNGVILKKTQFPLKEGESVFDILVKATRKSRIHMEYQGADKNQYGSVYIQGINNIYEFSCGDLSGWMYNVNGSYPNIGASVKKVKNGDHIQWNYTCDLGRDL